MAENDASADNHAHHHGDTDHDHGHDHSHSNHGHGHSPDPAHARADAAKVAGFMVFIFLISLAAHFLFADEVIYNWSQSHRNADAAVQHIQPGS